MNAGVENPYRILFEPVRIGPVTARNRFCQAPHGCGFGSREPSATAAMRGVKAEGGWGVVSTGQVEIHPSSDMSPLNEMRNWDRRDLPVLAAVVDAVRRHGALAALQLSHSGLNTSAPHTRAVPLAPSTGLTTQNVPAILEPFHARGMRGDDIAALRRWHRAAVERGVAAGYDIIYVYAGKFLGLPSQFLSPQYNRRDDAYGGALANRLRLLRELIEDAVAAAAGRAAIAVRLTIDDLCAAQPPHPQLDETFALLGELPDLWDVVISGWGTMAGTTRFDFDASCIDLLAHVKTLTSKPLVSVRFFQNPDDMVRLVRDGVVDLIGCARQSIADPFLPAKLERARPQDVRPCIQCNICVAADLSGAGVRCTQNPTFGEEWRRGWHPERIAPKTADARVLIVGAGPAGLECARALGARGYEVAVCDAAATLGGRVVLESSLPSLRRWRDVTDYRLGVLAAMPGVSLYPRNRLSAADIVETGYEHVVIATGASWRRDGLDRRGHIPALRSDAVGVFTPDDILCGRVPGGRVVVFDDDHYYMGGLLCELLAGRGCDVTLLTPAAEASVWTHRTMEQTFIQRRLIELGVTLLTSHYLHGVDDRRLFAECRYTGRLAAVDCDAVVMVAARRQNDALFDELDAARGAGRAPHLRSLAAIGDAQVPGLIAQAVYSGHGYARGFGEPAGVYDHTLTRRDLAPPAAAAAAGARPAAAATETGFAD